MNADGIKLTYIAAQYRVRLEFTKLATLKTAEPPEEFLEKARNKMRVEKKSGRIGFFRIFNNRLQRMWRNFRDMPGDDLQSVAVTIAVGGPLINGLEISPITSKDSKILAEISFVGDPAVFKNVSFDSFKAVVGYMLRKAGIKTFADPGRLFGAWFRCYHGLSLKDFSVFRLPDFEFPQKNLPYHIGINHNYGGIEVVVFDLKGSLQRGIDSLLLQLRQRTLQATKDLGFEYLLLESRIEAQLNSAMRGPERFGIDMPIVLLGAMIRPNSKGTVGVTPISSSATTSRALHNNIVKDTIKLPENPKISKISKKSTLDKYASIQITDDGQHAFIGRVDPRIYEESNAQIAENWANWFIALGINFGIKPDVCNQLVTLLKDRLPIEGIEIAAGVDPQAGIGCYFNESYKDKPTHETLNSNVRFFSKIVSVSEHQLIGEWQYKVPPKPGRDVYGNYIEAPASETPFLEEGSGVYSNSKGQYFANVSGIPIITHESIMVQKLLTIGESVNTRYGDIFFDGSCEINGDVEPGVSIEITGDLIVKGMISASRLKVGNDLIVVGGVIGSDQNTITVNGSMKCAYIERCHVTVKGNLEVEKCIIGAKVFACGNLHVDKSDGLISGGTTYCWGLLSAKYLGIEGGPPTNIHLGTDPLSNRRFDLRSTRHQKIERALQDQKRLCQTLRLEARKFPERFKARFHSERNKELRLAKLIEKSSAHLRLAALVHHKNRECELRVQFGSVSSTNIELCGVQWTNPLNVQDVRLVMTPSGRIRLTSVDEAG